MEKLTEQVGVKLSHQQYRQISGLADLAHESVSEYVRSIVLSHLAERHAHYKCMQSVFGTPDNLDTTRNG